MVKFFDRGGEYMSRLDTMARFEEPSIYDDSEVVSECSCCGTDLFAGEEVIGFDDEYFCDKECLVDWLSAYAISIVEL